MHDKSLALRRSVHPIFAQDHDTLVSEEQWVKASANLIREIGAEKFLRLLLENLKGNYLSVTIAVPSRTLAENSRSFVPKGDHGIDAHGATGWDVAGGESDSEKQSRHGCKCERVTGANAVEQAGHQTR
jgi:hypothetical protein